MKKIKEDCAKYYGKSNSKYWDQIITLLNGCGIKRLDQNNCFTNISLVDYVAKEYDKKNLKTFCFSGNKGGKLKKYVNNPIIIPSSITADIQVVEIFIGQIFCDILEREFSKS